MRILISTIRVQMANSFARSMFKFSMILQPIIYTFALYWMFKSSGRYDYITYVFLGSGLLSFINCIIYSSAGDINRERYLGTLPIIYSAPTKFILILLGKIIGNTILGIVPSILSYIILILICQKNFTIKYPLILLFSILVALFSFFCLALIFASIFTYSRKANILMNCLEYPLYILSGVLFPILNFPIVFRVMSLFFSPMWIVKVFEICLNGGSMFMLKKYTLIILTLSFLYLGIALFIMKLVDKNIRKKGTLELSA